MSKYTVKIDSRATHDVEEIVKKEQHQHAKISACKRLTESRPWSNKGLAGHETDSRGVWRRFTNDQSVETFCRKWHRRCNKQERQPERPEKRKN